MSSNYSIKLSSAGLIYKHFGREVLKNILSEQDENIVEIIYWKVYDVREINPIGYYTFVHFRN
jgi:uncharacterized UPF0160 family protein